MVLFGLDGKRTWDGMFKSEEQKMKEYKNQVAEQAENDFIQGSKLRANLDEAEYDEMTAHKLARLYNTVLSKQTESKILKVVKIDTQAEIREMKERALMGLEDKPAPYNQLMLKNKPTTLLIEDKEEIPMLESYEYDIDDYNKKDIENYMRGNTPFGTFQGIKNKHGVQNLNKDLLFKYALENNLLQYIKKKN